MRREQKIITNNFIYSFCLLSAQCYLLYAVFVQMLMHVKGKCKDCHTMHYSYEGRDNLWRSSGAVSHPDKGGCLGCHAQNTNGVN
jgi:hypothetical protein